MSKQVGTEGKEGAGYRPPKKILVPIDGSENSIRASEAAIRLAKDYNAELTVLIVVPVPSFTMEPPMGIGVPIGTFSEYYEYAQKNASRWIEEVTSSAKKQGVRVRGEVIQAKASVVEAITNAASGEKTDLIVIGTRGLGGFRKLLLGSVSSGVVTHAHCDVLVIR